MGKLNDKGEEVLDNTPVAIPVRFQRVDSLTEQIRRVIREEASRRAEAAGFETFEEADDFYIEDDYDPRSPHELSLEQELEGWKNDHGPGEDATSGTKRRGNGDQPVEEGSERRGSEAAEPNEVPSEASGGTGRSGA